MSEMTAEHARPEADGRNLPITSDRKRPISARRRSLLGAIAGMTLPGATVIATALTTAIANSEPRAATGGDLLVDWGPAPELVGLGPWFNSPPLTLAALRGHIVLVDFWTHGCINCLRTLPHVSRWAARHRDAGLVVIGVHSPEFAFERSPQRVRTAIRRFGVQHPVALDNDHATWTAWSNSYWPAHYLVDRSGRIRHRHFGEGDYDRTEAAIVALLG